jgi:hypothetical protein
LARYLVIDWDYQQLKILSATVSRGGVRIDKAVALEETHSPNPADAPMLGQLLRDRLKTAGIAPAPAMICVGRDRVIVKELRFPAVPAHEEPGLVRLQVVKELNEPADEVVIDYAVTDEVGSGGQRQALAIVLRRELLNAYKTMCQAAGLKLVAVAPRALGTAACLRRLAPGVPGDAAVACLIVDKNWAEFSIIKGEHLRLARSLAVGPTLAGEVRRTLAVFSGQGLNQPVQAFYLADSGEQAAFRERLQSLAGVPVQTVDPLAGAADVQVPAEARGSFAGAVGVLYSQAERAGLPINFMQPKQPRAPRDIGKRRLIGAAAVAAVALIGVVGVCYAKLAARDQKLDELFQEKNNLDRELLTFEDDVKRLKAFDDLSNSGVVWLDELYDLTDRFPDTGSIRLTQFTGDPLTRGKDTDKAVARLDLKGISREHAPVDALLAKFKSDGHYSVEPKVAKPNRQFERNRFPLEYSLRITVERQPPDKYIRRLSEQSLDRGRRNRGEVDAFGGEQP